MVAGRRPGRPAALARSLGVAADEVGWEEPVAGVVVNATPIGMGGESLPARLLDEATGVFDMAYGTEPTPTVVAARAAGLPVADGIEMLAAQAVEAFRIWTGVAVDIDVMLDAARRQMTAPISPPF